VGDDRLFFGVDDEDEEAEVLAEQLREGGSGEATLGGVDRGEERGDVNMGIPSLKIGAEVSVPRLALMVITERKGVLTFRLRLRMKRKRLGDFLQTSRATPRRSRGLNWRRNSDRGRNRLLGSLSERNTSRDAATLSQGEARGLVGLRDRRQLPRSGRGWGESKGRRTRKNWRDLGE
jgi:hypothetical protein